jgi:hypothetical protein
MNAPPGKARTALQGGPAQTTKLHIYRLTDYGSGQAQSPTNGCVRAQGSLPQRSGASRPDIGAPRLFTSPAFWREPEKSYEQSRA